MSLTALAYLTLLFVLGYLCLSKSPFWGVIICLVVYFINPNEHWWGSDFSHMRFSLFAVGITAVSYIFHKDKLNGIKVFCTRYRHLIFFLVLSCIVSFFAVDQRASYSRCYDLATFLIVGYFVLVSVTDDNKLFLLIFVILILGAVLGVEAYTSPRYGGRLEGIGPSDSNDSNNLALLLASLVPLGLPCFLATKKIGLKIAVIICIAFISNGIILANSRGAVLALIVACLSMVLLSGSWQFKKRMIVLLLVGFIGFWYLSDAAFFSRFRTVVDANADRGSGRLDIWSYGLEIAKDHLLGAGGDGFRRLSNHYMPNELLTGGERVPHNTYLLVLCEQGLIGLTLYLSFIYLCLKDLYAAIKRSSASDQLRFMISLSLMASLVCHLVGSFFGDRLYYQFFYILIALIIVVSYVPNQALPSLNKGRHE